MRWQELPLPSGLQPWRRSCYRNEKVKLEQTDKQTTNSPRILNPQRTVTSNGDLMPWIGSNVPVATESSTRRCPVLILSPVLLLLVAVISGQLGALGTDNGRVRFETAGESWQCKGPHSSRSWQLLQNQLQPGADSPKSDVRTFSRLESKIPALTVLALHVAYVCNRAALKVPPESYPGCVHFIFAEHRHSIFLLLLPNHNTTFLGFRSAPVLDAGALRFRTLPH